jgi:hypothetical protein
MIFMMARVHRGFQTGRIALGVPGPAIWLPTRRTRSK